MCWLRRFLYFVLVLTAPSAYAASGVTFLDEGLAINACSVARNNAIASFNNPSYVLSNVQNSDCRKSGNSFYLQVFLCYKPTSPNGQCGANYDSYILSPGGNVPSTDYTGNTTSSPPEFIFTYSNTPGNTCSSRPELTNIRAPGGNGTGLVCDVGCQMSVAIGDPALGPLYTASPTGQTCVVDANNPAPIPYDPNEPEPPKDPCPDDPNKECPGTGQPTDPETPPESGGGGFDCQTPPVCNSSTLACAQLYQTWKAGCVAENSANKLGEKFDAFGDKISDGLDDLGDKLGEKIDGTNSRLDGIGEKIDGTNNRLDTVNDNLNDINSNISQTRSWLGGLLDDIFGDGSPIDDNGTIPGVSERVSDVTYGPDNFNTSGFGLPRSCPSLLTSVSLPLFGNTYDFDFSQLCGLLDMIGRLLIVIASFWGAVILLRSHK